MDKIRKCNYYEGSNKENTINLLHKYWRDDIIINDDMTFKRHLFKNETGILYLNDEKINVLWSNWSPESVNNELTIMNIIDNEKLIELQNKNIQNKINKSVTSNPYNLYVINLKERTDRKEQFIQSFDQISNTFNVNFFDAIKHKNGAHGCGLSHLYLIMYAKLNNLPYIIVAEDDCLLKVNTDEVNYLLNLLTNNLDKWNIFNGCPTYGHMLNKLDKLGIKNSFNDNLLDINWGQSTAFMIYNKSSYDIMLNYNFRETIDLYISHNFIQTIYRNKPFSIQRASYSNIENKNQNTSYEKFFESSYDVLKKIKVRDEIFISKNESLSPSVIGQLTGGLGNQFFIIAVAYAYSLKYNTNFLLSEKWKDMNKDRPSYWDNIFYNIKNMNCFTSQERISKTKTYNEPKFSYTQIPKFKSNIVLKGYFQSPKYFEDYENEIRELFKLPKFLKDFAYEKLLSLNDKTLVAIHIRRGDYLKNQDYHIIQPLEYYKNSMKIIEQKLGLRPTYVYFSDDKNWVRNNFTLSTDDIVMNCDTDYEEFAVMEQCHHFIIANSSFSWWASYLSDNKDKIIIAPEKWFGTKGPKDYEDIYHKSHIVEINENFFYKKDEYFMGFITCKLYEKKRKLQNLKNIPFNYRYFIGDNTLKEPLEDIDNKIVYLPCNDYYESLPEKVYEMLKWIRKNYPNVKQIIKTDDDVSFNFLKFPKFFDKKIDYGGLKVFNKKYYGICHLGKCNDSVLSKTKILVPETTYCAGPFYILSVETVDIVIKELFKENTIYEDQSVGYCLNKLNIYPENINIKNNICYWI